MNGSGHGRLRRLLGAAMVATTATLWGGWAFVIRPSGLLPLQSALVVMLVLALPAPIVLFRDRTGFRDRGAVTALAVLGVVDAANIALYFPALSRGPVAVATLTHYLAPVLVALFAALVPGERRSRRALAAAPLSLAGLLLVLGPPRSAPATTALLGGASAVAYAALIFAARRAARSFSPLAVTSLHAALSALLLLAVFGTGIVPPAGPGLFRVGAAALVLGIVASVLFYGGISRISAPVGSALTYLEPVSAAVIGALFMSEPLRPLAVAGAALVVGTGGWVALERAPGSG
jgi:drug/metabolite transporter (DMT)-like permease